MGTEQGAPTLTTVRIARTDPNTAFTGMTSAVPLRVVRVSISEFSTAAVVERSLMLGEVSPTAQGSEVIMERSGHGGGLGEGGEEGAQHVAYTVPGIAPVQPVPSNPHVVVDA